jgi:phosphoserine phosphatase
MKIAFDVDGTLTDHAWLHRELRKFAEEGHDVIVWSGGGVPYAEWYVQRNNLPARIAIKCSEAVDIAFDDATESLAGATVTIQVPLKHNL